MDENLDDTAQDNDLGYLGEYGVLIVPPSDESGAWFVTLASWDDEAEAYGAGTDGPLLGSREQAMEQAGRVLDWLAAQKGQGDLTRVWLDMQANLGTEEEPMWPKSYDAWGRPRY